MNPQKRWLLQLSVLGAVLGVLLAVLSDGGGRCPLPAFQKKSAALGSPSTVSAAVLSAAAPAPADWRVHWAGSLIKLRREPAALPPMGESPVRVEMARNEYESVQLVFVGGSAPTRVRIAVGDLLHENGKAAFPADVVELRRVDYVLTRKPDYPAAYVGAWPDPLPPAHEIDIAAGVVQPVWITLGAPDSLLPGVYTGPITIFDDQGRQEELSLQVTVWDFSLPRQGRLATAFDLYRGRLERAYREFVPGGQFWEGRFDELEHLYYLDMLKHRISPIISADPYAGLFRANFPLYQALGITAFALGRFGGNQGPDGNSWPADDAALRHAMDWYRQAAVDLATAGILETAYVYAFDEPKPEDPRVPGILSALKQADARLRTLVVMHALADPDAHKAWLKDADLLCQRITSYDPLKADAWRSAGKAVWLYVSSPEAGYPGLAIDEPAIGHRLLPWLCWKLRAQGLLFWCVNFWEGDPRVNPASFAKDQNGNGFLYYPALEGPVPSVRLETLRDGLEDYEYLALLRDAVEGAKSRGGADAQTLGQAEALLAVDDALVEGPTRVTADPEALLSARRAIAAAIVKLQAAASEPGASR